MRFVDGYPHELEQWWTDFALRQFKAESLHFCEHRLEQRIQFLSDQFTKERTRLAKDYFTDPELLAAYGLFFFPQSYVRTSLVLQEIISRGWLPEGGITVLDLGAGPGPASFAAASLFPNQEMEITAVDRSPDALRAMERIGVENTNLWRSLRIKTAQCDALEYLKRVNRRFDLILTSFSFNEFGMRRAAATSLLINALSDRGMVLVLEPALKHTSENLEQWRDEIVTGTDLHIWAPCPHDALCPLLKEGKFWCHEVRSWQPPSTLHFLNRHLYRQAHVLKFSFLAFGIQEPDTMSPSAFRLISPVSKRKKTLIFTGCCQDGTKKDFQLSGTLTERERKNIQDWERGDILDSRSMVPGKVT